MTLLDSGTTRKAQTGTPPVGRAPRLGSAEVVLALVIVAILARGWLWGLIASPAAAGVATVFVSVLLGALPFLLAGTLVAAAMRAFVRPLALHRWLQARPLLGRAWLAVPAAALAAIALPAGDEAVVGETARLIRDGVPSGAAFAYSLAAPAVSPVVLVATAVAFPGEPLLVFARALASLALAIVLGLLWHRFGRAEWLAAPFRAGAARPRDADRSWADADPTWPDADVEAPGRDQRRAELPRGEAELTRGEAELTRGEAELIRVEAELIRVEAGDTQAGLPRAETELTRVEAGDTRAGLPGAETGLPRAEADQTRADAELTWADSGLTRASVDATRGERFRAHAELPRVDSGRTRGVADEQPEAEPGASDDRAMDATAPKAAGWPEFWAYARIDAIRGGGLLVIGAFAMALLTAALPADWPVLVAARPVFSLVALALLAVLLSSPAEAGPFLAAGLAPFSFAARLTFLVVGPAVNLRRFSQQSIVYGPGFGLRFAPATLVLAIGSAAVVAGILR